MADLDKPKKLDWEGKSSASLEKNKEDNKKYVDSLKLNNAVREIFLNRFIHMFRSYESFVIQPNQHDMDQWLTTRETMQNFDKTAFLSDQPEPHLPFLSRFIETQMFATLIDNKIVSLWEESDPYLKIFETRIKLLNGIGEHCADPSMRAPTYEQCETYHDTEALIEKRCAVADVIAPPPKAIEGVAEVPSHRRQIPGTFPLLDADVLNEESTPNRGRRRTSTQWKRRDRRHQQSEHLQLNSDQRGVI